MATKTKRTPEKAPEVETAEEPKAPPARMCEVCGNEYDKAFDIVMASNGNEQRHTFDSFECAIHALAPQCAHCGCRVVGHGVEAQGVVYCCAACARLLGRRELRDRAG
jgi:hypothetical protein